MTDIPNHDAVKRLRQAFRQVTREHDRLMLLVADPRTTGPEIDDHLDHVREATAEYLKAAHTVT